MITFKMTAHCSADDCVQTEEFDADVTQLKLQLGYGENIGVTDVDGVDDKQVSLPAGWQWMDEYGDGFSRWLNCGLFCPACVPEKVKAQQRAVEERERRVAEWKKGKKKS